MEDRRSARSHENDLKAWHIIPEHAPMLTSSLRRRSAHLPGLRAPSRQGADQTWGVGARRRQRSSATGSSFISSTRIRKSSAAYISAPKVRFASCAPMHSKARRWPHSGSAARHRHREQPLRWWLRPTQGRLQPAGELAAAMLRSCSPYDTSIRCLTQGSPPREKIVHNAILFTVVPLSNITN